jgi:hypothetical protein
MALAPVQLTDAQQRQHGHVLAVAESNLDLVINQIESLDHQRYDNLLEILDTVKEAFKKVKL